MYEAPTANTKLILINDESQKLGLQNYLIIDEYDNFTNTILNEKGEDVYHAITHADGFIVMYSRSLRVHLPVFS